MDLFELGKDLKYIGDLLETIRQCSKKQSLNYHKPPYDSDVVLLQCLLDEKIFELIDTGMKK